MSSELIKIGRKNVPLDEFKASVARAQFYRDVCRELGFNEGSILTIKKGIAKYGLDASHLERYSITENVRNSREKNQRAFALSEDNLKYFMAFQSTFQNQESWNTYKATIGKFLESLGEKDFAMANIDEILSFVGESKDRASHLKSLVNYVAHNDINNYAEIVSKPVLVWVLSSSALQRSSILSNEPVFPDEIDQANVTYMEGLIISVYVNKYERDSNARKKCLEKYGTICSVCDKKMSDMYGELFSEKIQVHHLNPMCQYDKEHEIDPIKDLRPVCPNCHFIIHSKKGEPFTIDEVRAFYRNS